MKNLKNETIFVCSNCGNEYSQWMGKCSACGEWNTLKEVKSSKFQVLGKNRGNNSNTTPTNLDQIELKDFKRISTKIGEFDRVLGGDNQGTGIVPGSVILLGGDPGIGKSTLLLQASAKIDGVFYISGEESQEQIKLRANRLGVNSSNFKILSNSDIDLIIEQISSLRPHLVVIDSIQTMYDSAYPSTPGSIVQVRECALKFQQLAKLIHIPIILVGHVTKDGSVAGPKTLEHLVDVVLYLEGERYHGTRILRGVKNRFGATDEIGVFEMVGNGLSEVKNPSSLFLEERLKGSPGSVITATMEGTRPFLVEIQALTSPTSFGFPRRTSSGFDLNRLQLLIAVLSKKAGLNLNNQDVYLNIVGGFKIKEPAADLAVCVAIASAYKNKKVISNMCVFGEVGLSGEIRTVSHSDKRLNEAKRLGFEKKVDAKTISDAIEKSLV